MKIEIKSPKNECSAVKLGKDLAKDNVKIENVYLDGTLVGTVCVSSEADKERAIKTLEKAFKEANGDPHAAMELISRLGMIAEKEIQPDEEIEHNGKKYFISYSQYKLYTLNGNELANCDDLDEATRKSMKPEVIKALLTSRVK